MRAGERCKRVLYSARTPLVSHFGYILKFASRRKRVEMLQQVVVTMPLLN